MTLKTTYIWKSPSWPQFRWDKETLLGPLGNCRFHQGALLAQMKELGFEIRRQAWADVLTEEALKTAEIEGEILDPKAVRSSVTRRLGLPTVGIPEARSREADGVVEIILDATKNHKIMLDAERLFSWHAALFPTGYSGMHKIVVGNWRDGQSGPMRVISGPVGQEKVHYEAPPNEKMENEMSRFLKRISFGEILPADVVSVMILCGISLKPNRYRGCQNNGPYYNQSHVHCYALFLQVLAGLNKIIRRRG